MENKKMKITKKGYAWGTDVTNPKHILKMNKKTDIEKFREKIMNYANNNDDKIYKILTEKNTLADKSWKICSDLSNPKYDLDVIATKDVKEFIKKLKENLYESDTVFQICRKIDKLAGEELLK